MAVTTEPERRRGRPGRRWGCWVALGLLIALGVGGCWQIRSARDQGERFYAVGVEINEILDRMEGALAAKDIAQLETFFGPRFRGKRFGWRQFNEGPPRLLPDGTRLWTLRQVKPGVAKVPEAIQEWSAYLDRFEEIGEVHLRLERITHWSEGLVLIEATFELTGRLVDETEATMDRAWIRLGFEPSKNRGLVLRRSSAIEGTRTIRERAQFEEVGRHAGIHFENKFYPRFLSETLVFPMIRYGPGGIAAADFDGDGFEDLFIPDGEESRLFRNRRNGTFEDVTAAAGLSGLSGVSVGLFADYDNDGHRDLFVSRTFEPNQLFRGNGDGTFTDVTARAGIEADCCTTVASWADYDLDGDLDLYVGRYLDPRERIPTTFYARNGEPNTLYRNEGDGTFTEVAKEAGVDEVGLCLGTVFGDYDNDGDPDLYVVNDFGRNTLYRNEGDGTFEDVTVEAGALAYGAGMSAAFADYDNDQDLDLYVANIRSEHAWFADEPTIRLYLANNLSQGVWRTDMPLFLEIYRQSGNQFLEVFRQMASGNTLLRNHSPAPQAEGEGEAFSGPSAGEPPRPAFFQDVTWTAHANPHGWFWGSTFGDFDNDGWQDLYSTNGWVYNQRGTELELDFLHNVVTRQRDYKRGDFFDPENFGDRSWHGWERNRYLRNMGDGTFHEMGQATGTDLLLNSRGIAVADFENRGLLDIAVAASTDRHALLRNAGVKGQHWLAVELKGAGARLPDGTNRDAVGARITLKAGGMIQTREVVLGDGYGSQNSLRAHFGLAGIRRVKELTVRWPRSGREQTFRNLAADRLVVIEEGVDTMLDRSVTPSPVPASGGDDGR